MASHRSYTEAVPLSLSSMAHMPLALDEGVMDGICQVMQHTLMACVNYSRAVHPPHDWTFRDIRSSEHAWKAVPGAHSFDLPAPLAKLGFQHQYLRHCLLYLGEPPKHTHEQELEIIKDWESDTTNVVGRVCLKYASQERLTADELDGDADEDEIPPVILYKVLIEYRSLPPTGNQEAVEAEELSMLSFGGSVDDDVKYGALASLYDQHAKYVLEIYSVRGKKYKFDLMDATLSDGTVPRWKGDSDDPFVKSLCVTVTDHGAAGNNNQAVTRMFLTLEGNLRNGFTVDSLPPFSFHTLQLQATFGLLDRPPSVLALPSRQALLLDAQQAGRVYVNGRCVTIWGSDPRLGTDATALFGVDLHGIPMWHGRIVDFEVLKMEYSVMWQEILIDARHIHLNIASKLLYRLMHGQDPDDDEYDDEEPSVHEDCLESQIMASSKYDPVGICAKALATRFAMEFGKSAFPCLPHEVEWVQYRLGDKVPVVVPQRVINVLRRGGYFDLKRVTSETWFTDASRPAEGDVETELINESVRMLREVECTDVKPANIMFVKINDDDAIEHKQMCRYDGNMKQFYVNDAILKMEKPAFMLGMYVAQEHPDGNVLVHYLVRHTK